MTATAVRSTVRQDMGLAAILRAHSIPVRVTADGHVLAYNQVIGPDGLDASTWVSVDGWSPRRLYQWLGY